MLVKRRTMPINTVRRLMAEFGIVVAEGPGDVDQLVGILVDAADERIPAPLRARLVGDWKNSADSPAPVRGERR